MKGVINTIGDLSRVVHDWIWGDVSQSLCSRAWWKQEESRFWKAWTYVFSRKHCRGSYLHYHRRNDK